MKKLIAVVMMFATLNAQAMPDWVCEPMQDLGQSTIELKEKGISLQTAMMIAKTQWRDNGTAEYIQDYLSAVIQIGYETTLDGDSYGEVVYDMCRQQELNIY